MKKISSQKVMYPLMLGYAVLAAVSPAFASNLNPISGTTDFKDLLDKLVSTVLGFLGIIATLYLIYAGFKYVTAGGDSKKAGEAKEGITHAIIGIVVALIGYLLVKFIFSMVGATSNVSNF